MEPICQALPAPFPTDAFASPPSTFVLRQDLPLKVKFIYSARLEVSGMPSLSTSARVIGIFCPLWFLGLQLEPPPVIILFLGGVLRQSPYYVGTLLCS